MNKFVHFEFHTTIEEAIDREKYLKGKNRSFKLKLKESNNLNWKDLSEHPDLE